LRSFAIDIARSSATLGIFAGSSARFSNRPKEVANDPITYVHLICMTSNRQFLRMKTPPGTPSPEPEPKRDPEPEPGSDPDLVPGMDPLPEPLPM
jgi:hypothetical protein